MQFIIHTRSWTVSSNILFTVCVNFQNQHFTVLKILLVLHVSLASLEFGHLQKCIFSSRWGIRKSVRGAVEFWSWVLLLLFGEKATKIIYIYIYIDYGERCAARVLVPHSTVTVIIKNILLFAAPSYFSC